MNAGPSYNKAKEQAQADANLDGQPRWIHHYNRNWWIDKEKCYGAEKIEPKKQEPK